MGNTSCLKGKTWLRTQDFAVSEDYSGEFLSFDDDVEFELRPMADFATEFDKWFEEMRIKHGMIRAIDRETLNRESILRGAGMKEVGTD